MSARTYNLSLLAGMTFIGVGVGMGAGLPAALVTVGALVIGLTVFGAYMARGK